MPPMVAGTTSKSPGLQRLTKRNHQFSPLNRLARQGHVGHRHARAPGGGIERQFVEIEGDVPIVMQRLAAMG